MGFSLSSFLGSAKDVILGKSPDVQIADKKVLSPEQEAALKDTLLPFLTGDVSQGTKGPEFGGQEGFKFSAPVTGGETSSLAALEALAMSGVEPGAGQDFLSQLLSGGVQDQTTGPLSQFIQGQETGQGTDFLTSLFSGGADAFQVGPGSALAQFFEPDSADFDEFFELAIQQPLLEAFEKDILPSITRRAAGTGNLFGSAVRENIEGAQNTLIEQLASQRAELGFKTREAGLDRSLEAAGLAEQLGAQGFESARGREVGAAETVSGQRLIASGQELTAAGQIEANQLEASGQQLQAALASEGFNLDKAGLQLRTITENIQAQGIPREAQNLEIASQYADFLRKEGLQDLRINQLLAAIGLPTLENIATVTPGTTGLLTAFLSGGGLS